MFGDYCRRACCKQFASKRRKQEPGGHCCSDHKRRGAQAGTAVHIGAPRTLKGYGSASGAIQSGSSRAMFMDFFWMPVVEPMLGERNVDRWR